MQLKNLGLVLGCFGMVAYVSRNMKVTFEYGPKLCGINQQLFEPRRAEFLAGAVFCKPRSWKCRFCGRCCASATSTKCRNAGVCSTSPEVKISLRAQQSVDLSYVCMLALMGPWVCSNTRSRTYRRQHTHQGTHLAASTLEHPYYESTDM